MGYGNTMLLDGYDAGNEALALLFLASSQSHLPRAVSSTTSTTSESRTFISLPSHPETA